MKSSVNTALPALAERAVFLPATTARLRVQRDRHNIIRRAAIPKATVLVDSREQAPLPIFFNHPNWIASERRTALRTGDYSVEGMENLLALERKSLADLVHCTVTSRERFIANCVRLAEFRWKAILVEASYEDLKRGWDTDEIQSDVHPNSVCGLLDAIEAKFGIPVLLTSRHRELATERAASWLSKHFTYWWLEQNGFGRVLIDSDKL
jgi:ERCC4-type nuclease